ncbi:MAG: hypothetical protein AAGK21_05015, partial [Bacteroidota bacterium]
GEAGKVSGQKWQSLLRRFPNTHFALARWNERLAPHEAIVRKALGTRRRQAPIDLLRIPPTLADTIEPDGTLRLTFGDAAGALAGIERVRLGPSGEP